MSDESISRQTDCGLQQRGHPSLEACVVRLSLCTVTVFCTAIVPGIGVHSHYRREGDSDNENPDQKLVTGGPLLRMAYPSSLGCIKLHETCEAVESDLPSDGAERFCRIRDEGVYNCWEQPDDQPLVHSTVESSRLGQCWRTVTNIRNESEAGRTRAR